VNGAVADLRRRPTRHVCASGEVTLTPYRVRVCRGTLDHEHHLIVTLPSNLPVRATYRLHACPTSDEIPPPHSITSSATASRFGGMVSPSALAVFMLMANSTLVARCTGRSPGFSPLRMRPT
jgi:hypothetical protein